MHVEDKTMKPEGFRELAKVASNTKPGKMRFSDCNLTSDKVNSFAQGASECELQV